MKHGLTSARFHLSRVSGNKKTGFMPVTTTSRNTCHGCPFDGNGCYAQSGPLALHWRKVSDGSRGVDWRQHLADLASLPTGSPLRLNQAGDLPNTMGRISRRYLKALADVVKRRGLKAWTYTHHDPASGENAALIRAAQSSGLTVNVSTETESAADRAVSAGLPAVLAVPSTETRNTWHTPAGNVVLVCPAQRRETSCSDCMLCHQAGRGRRVIVAFVAHGTGKRKADAVIQSKEPLA